jgi:kinesin family protein 3/17
MASEAVKVIVRCRPINQREKDLNCKVIKIPNLQNVEIE